MFSSYYATLILIFGISTKLGVVRKTRMRFTWRLKGALNRDFDLQIFAKAVDTPAPCCARARAIIHALLSRYGSRQRTSEDSITFDVALLPRAAKSIAVSLGALHRTQRRVVILIFTLSESRPLCAIVT